VAGEAAFDEASRQLTTYFEHLRSSDGMLFHAYDETRAKPWADPVTGRSTGSSSGRGSGTSATTWTGPVR
jgi:rhamnogalacturonyl hydrolase YesR